MYKIELIGTTLWIKREGSPIYTTIDMLPGIAVATVVIMAIMRKAV